MKFKGILMEIEIEVVGKGKINAILDERNPDTARKIYENLPIEGEANFGSMKSTSMYP